MFSYVVARDYGFAPNPFYGYCTLATCKPEIRRLAAIGDLVVGTGSASKGRQDHLVFAMLVDETLTYDEYWKDPRFRVKRPALRGSLKQAYGDNVYRRHRGAWLQADSHHSLPGGAPNPLNIEHDTRVSRVLVGLEYAYWGGDGPRLPPRFTGARGDDLRGGRGHRSNFSESFIRDVLRWLRLPERSGYLGIPAEWRRPASR